MKKAVTKNDCQFSYLIKREENISNEKTYTLFNRDDVRRSLML